MMLNDPDSTSRERMAKLAAESSFYRRMEKLLGAHPTLFTLGSDREGLDLGVENQAAGRPNRSRCKMFPIGKEKFAIFFYKPSLLPYSRDRFGYGGRVFDPAAVSDAEIAEWLDFVAEGLPPDRRPAKLLRGFPYDVPY